MFENYFSYISTKVYVVGAQKYCLNETILLSTQNTCLSLGDNCIQNFHLGGGGGGGGYIVSYTVRNFCFMVMHELSCKM